MKAIFIILLSFLGLSSFAQEQYKLAIVKKAKKWGAIDVYGKLVIPCEYDFLEITCSDLIAAKKNGKFGFIDRSNHIKISFVYDSVAGFYKHKAIVVKGKKFGFINEQNSLIIDYKFEQADNFSDGLAAVRVGDLWGFANEKGELVIPPTYYLLIDSFHGNYCLASSDAKVGLINRKGEVVIPFQYDLFTQFVEGSEDLIITYEYPCTYQLLRVKDNKYEKVCNYKFSYLDEYDQDEGNYKECQTASPSNFLEFKIDYYGSDCGVKDAVRSKCSGRGIINKQGEIIFCAEDKFEFLDKNHFLCFWQLRTMTHTNTDNFQLADSTGKITDLSHYANVGEYDNGILTVFSYLENGGKWGGVNWNLETVVPFIYDDIVDLHDSTMVVEMSYKFYVTNVKGDYISKALPFDIYNVKVLDHIITFKTREGERLYGVLDHKGNVLHEPQFDEPIKF